MALALMFFMPRLARPQPQRLTEQAQILKNSNFVVNVLLSVLVFTAMFTAYTYLADILLRLANIATAEVGWWLMGFGAIGLLGNGLGGRLVDRQPLMSTAAFTSLLAVGMLASLLVIDSLWLLGLALAVWGIAYTALFPICQVRVMKAASHAQALAGTLNVSAANAGTGFGAIIGGLVIAYWDLATVSYVAAGIAGTAILLALCMHYWRG